MPSTTAERFPFPYLDAEAVAQRLPMNVAVESMRAAFGDDTQCPVRVALGKSLFMSARVGEFTGIKVVSTTPGNPQGTVTAYDAAGTPLGMVDGVALTSLRTGAGSGFATALLAREDCSTLAMLGTGLIAAHQVEAVCCVRPIRTVVVWSRRAQSAQAFAAQLQSNHPSLQVRVSSSADAAVLDADVVCCATPAKTPIFSPQSVRAGTHINAVGAFKPDMAEVPADVVRSARVFVDDCGAAAQEAGDLLQANREPDGEMRDILAGRVVGRSNRDEVTLFKSVGIASQDVASAVAALLGIEALAGAAPKP